MNLIIPIASSSKFFSLEEYGYPKPLVEIKGKPMIQLVIENLTKEVSFKKIIFIARQDDCDNYHLDNILNLLSPIPPEIIKLNSDTEGALCSILLAIEHASHDDPLVIANADQIFDEGVGGYLKKFIESNLDACCLTFDSVHPRWSYVKADEMGYVIETAEKNPISKHAIAGFYMYKNSLDFFKFAMDSIRHGASVDGKYFVSPVFNEFVLANKLVGHYRISNSKYHTFYSPQKIEDYESRGDQGGG